MVNYPGKCTWEKPDHFFFFWATNWLAPEGSYSGEDAQEGLGVKQGNPIGHRGIMPAQEHVQLVWTTGINLCEYTMGLKAQRTTAEVCEETSGYTWREGPLSQQCKPQPYNI